MFFALCALVLMVMGEQHKTYGRKNHLINIKLSSHNDADGDGDGEDDVDAGAKHYAPLCSTTVAFKHFPFSMCDRMLVNIMIIDNNDNNQTYLIT